MGWLELLMEQLVPLVVPIRACCEQVVASNGSVGASSGSVGASIRLVGASSGSVGAFSGSLAASISLLG